MSNATIDGVSKASLSLVANRNDSVETLVDGDVKEEFRHVAGPEHLVHRRKVGGALLRIEIRGKYATGNTLSPQELAGPTWPSATNSAAAAGTGSSRPSSAAASTRVGTHLRGSDNKGKDFVTKKEKDGILKGDGSERKR